MAEDWETVKKKDKVVKEKSAAGAEAPKTVLSTGKWGSNNSQIKTGGQQTTTFPVSKPGSANANNWRGKESSAGDKGTSSGAGATNSAANDYPTLFLPSGDSAEAVAETKKIIAENTKRFVIRRERNNRFALVPYALDDWLFADSKTKPTAAFWEQLNVTLGNTDGTLRSTVHMLAHGLGLAEDVIHGLDLKNVDLFCGVVARHFELSADNKTVWESFSRGLSHGFRLANDNPLCSKMKFLCGEQESIYVLKNSSHKGDRIDFLGGKLSVPEYLKYADNQDKATLFASCVKASLEDLKLTTENSLVPTQTNGLYATADLQVVRKTETGQLNATLKFLQVAPYFLKVTVTKVEEIPTASA